MVWMGRHDYQVDAEQRIATLDNVAIDCTEYGKAYEAAPALPEKPAGLAWPAPVTGAAAEEAHPQSCGFGKALVAGCPLWTQGPVRIWCPRCREDMVYVVAMTTAEAFEPRVTINNDSGFQYHFACAACRIVSVIAQWT